MCVPFGNNYQIKIDSLSIKLVSFKLNLIKSKALWKLVYKLWWWIFSPCCFICWKWSFQTSQQYDWKFIYIWETHLISTLNDQNYYEINDYAWMNHDTIEGEVIKYTKYFLCEVILLLIEQKGSKSKLNALRNLLLFETV